MQEFYVYHVVTEQPMELGQIIIFDKNNSSGVKKRVKDREKIEIYDPTSGSGSLLINIGKTASK